MSLVESRRCVVHVCLIHTLARGEKARVLVSTRNDVLETRRESIQTSIEPGPSRDLASLGIIIHTHFASSADIIASKILNLLACPLRELFDLTWFRAIPYHISDCSWKNTTL